MFNFKFEASKNDGLLGKIVNMTVRIKAKKLEFQSR
jgi:hypothetical protein